MEHKTSQTTNLQVLKQKRQSREKKVTENTYTGFIQNFSARGKFPKAKNGFKSVQQMIFSGWKENLPSLDRAFMALHAFWGEKTQNKALPAARLMPTNCALPTRRKPWGPCSKPDGKNKLRPRLMNVKNSSIAGPKAFSKLKKDGNGASSG